MNICIVMSLPLPPEEGMGNYVYGSSKKFIEKGHNVTIITRSPSVTTKKSTIDGMEIIKASFFPLYPFHVHIHGLFVHKIMSKLESKCDVVHFHTPLVPPVRTTLPIVTTIHNPMLIDTQYRWKEKQDLHSFIERKLGKWISYPLEMKLLKKSDCITTVSTSVAQELAEYGITQDKIRVIGNGVDTEEFFPVRKKNGDEYILYTGRLDRRKGLFDLLETGKIVSKTYPDIKFILVGKGELKQALQDRIEALSLKENFKFLGFVERKRLIQLYQNATVHVIPSHYEGLPTVLLEAMACGLPVVATGVSGNLDVISSGKDGMLVPPSSPKEMADAIMMLLEDKNLREKIGDAARKTIEERYSWDKIADKILSCYASVLNANGKN